MWQPGRTQWIIICATAIVLVLAWPPSSGRSLGIKLLNRAADPLNTLPMPPDALPMGMDDNGDAVAEHDALLTAYYQAYASSPLVRVRMQMKTMDDPVDAATTRQALVALAVAAALTVWKLTSSA